MRIRFKVEEGGWARAWIENAGVAFPMVVSYISDSLGDLTRASLEVLSGRGHAEFLWNKEPGSYRWQLQAVGEKQIKVEVDEYSSEFLGADQPQGSGADRFVATISSTDFARAVVDLMDSVPPSLYNRSWEDYSFPKSEVERLRGLLSGGNGGAA